MASHLVRDIKSDQSELPVLKEDQEVTAAAQPDPDDLALAGKQVSTMISVWVQSSRPKLANKGLLVFMRYSPEVIDDFRSTGARWQTRMNVEIGRAHV